MIFNKTLKQTIEDYGLMAKKALGQNFLLNQNITDKIIKLSLEKQHLENFNAFHVLEIGPGPGGLTRAVLNALPKTLTVIEADERCIAIMNDLKQQTHIPMQILHEDALKINIASLNMPNIQIVSNLPYHISVPLLTNWLKQTDSISALTLMFQQEVAERITAPVKTKAYGRLSVISQLVCKIDKLLTLNPECFVPAPKIYSSVLLFTPLNNRPSVEILEKVEVLTSLAFSQRRKMIRQSLKTIQNIEKICEQLNIPLTVRAEEISPQQYLMMAQSEFFR